MGIFNRILVSLVACNSLIFFNKCVFYQKIVEEVAQEMTLTGQEARILTRYYFPDHPNYLVMTELCKKYKELSKVQQEKQDEVDRQQFEKRMFERRLDRDFEKRLKSIDLEDEEATDTEEQGSQQAKVNINTASGAKK